jgi:hypothetical protein
MFTEMGRNDLPAVSLPWPKRCHLSRVLKEARVPLM